MKTSIILITAIILITTITSAYAAEMHVNLSDLPESGVDLEELKKKFGDPAETKKGIAVWAVVVDVDVDRPGFAKKGEKRYLGAYQSPIFDQKGTDTPVEWNIYLFLSPSLNDPRSPF
jgi:hypothetical protein